MVRLAHALAAGAATLALGWLAAGDEDTTTAQPAIVVATGSGSVEEPQVPAPAPVQQTVPSALAEAAARLCADGCDEPAVPRQDPAAATPVAVAVAQPADLDAWALSPEPLQAAGEPAPSPPRLFNTPPAPDEQDATPADESDPYAPPPEESVAE